jgi:stage II sporulation protein R
VLFLKKKVVSISLLAAAALGLALCCCLQFSQQRLAGKLIRLHVVANSDSAADQAIKLRVRDAVLVKTQEILRGADDPKQALAKNLGSIECAAERELTSLGCGDDVRVSLGKELFPTREYETFSLPAGVYESLRVRIGAADGHNWWCVIFPSICMTASMDDFTRAAETAGFTDGEVRLITEENGGYVIKFKTLELFQKFKNLFLGAHG